MDIYSFGVLIREVYLRKPLSLAERDKASQVEWDSYVVAMG